MLDLLVAIIWLGGTMYMARRYMWYVDIFHARRGAMPLHPVGRPSCPPLGHPWYNYREDATYYYLDGRWRRMR